jgi:hypothetical protein
MLSLAKHCCRNRSSFLIHLVFVIPPFALMQKVEPKMEASPNRSARFAAHAQQQSYRLHLSFYFVCKQHVALLLYNFFKTSCLSSGVTNDRRCIPLSFS